MYDESSFYSVDRLIEFGMSMAIANQMTQSMNQTMQNMHIPGAGNPLQPAVPQVFYAMLDGNQAGPFSETEITRLIGEKKISSETYIWIPGMRDWKRAKDMPEIARLVALAPPEFKGGAA
jgi:hypothetical protein